MNEPPPDRELRCSQTHREAEMSKKKKKNKGGSQRRSGGSMMSMRSGVKGFVGQKKKGKQEVTFMTVMGWVVVVAILGVVTWGMGGI